MTKQMAFKLALDSILNTREDYTMDQVRELQNHILAKHEGMIKGMNEFDSLSSKNPGPSRMKNNLRNTTSKGMMDLMTQSCAEFMGEEYWLSLNNSAERDAVKRMYQRVRERLVG